jgi:hypothetical protein
MSNIVIFKEGQIPQYLKSVDTREYVTELPVNKESAQEVALPGVLINPDLSQVEGIPLRFWKLQRGQVVEMTPEEKQILLDTDTAVQEAKIFL